MRNRLWLFFFLVFMPVAVTAQVTAKQGAQQHKERFESPMILELPFFMIDQKFWSVDTAYGPKENLSKFICDGVSISDLRFQARPPKGDTLEIGVSFKLTNEPGADKLVDILFEVIQDGISLAKSLSIKNIDLEEGYTIERKPREKIRMTLPSEKLSAPLLRITMATRDNL